MNDKTAADESKPESGTPAPAIIRAIDIVDAAEDAGKTISFTKTFTATWKNPETGVVSVGTFVATRPNLGKLGLIAVLKAKLNGGEKVDFQTDFMHAMMADLHYILTTTPEWWKPDEFYTASPLRDVWDHVGAWLNTFLGKRVG